MRYEFVGDDENVGPHYCEGRKLKAGDVVELSERAAKRFGKKFKPVADDNRPTGSTEPAKTNDEDAL